MQSAPYFAEVAEGPAEGRCAWVSAEDGLRLRLGLWARDGARGTVLLFPGRTEYIEKYGRVAAALAAGGYATLAIDWRGQGLSDRVTEDENVGHVLEFSDYQRDVAAMLDAARASGLPRPWFVLAHSMGGCIALRSLTEGIDVAGTVFSAPMWGIRMAGPTRPAAWALSWSGARVGLGHRYAPGTGAASYVSEADFEGNMLTTDAESYAYMRRQVTAHPELALGGPSLRWLNEALRETRALARRPAPALPCLAYLGGNERIVDPDRIRRRMDHWPGGELVELRGAEHEVLMERAACRDAALQGAIAFFERHGSDATSPAPVPGATGLGA